MFVAIQVGRHSHWVVQGRWHADLRGLTRWRGADAKGAAFAEKEGRSIADRTKQALAAAKARGVVLGNAEQTKGNKQGAVTPWPRHCGRSSSSSIISPVGELLRS